MSTRLVTAGAVSSSTSLRTRARIVENRLASESELSDLTAAPRSHLNDPGTLVISSLFPQVWGPKSAP